MKETKKIVLLYLYNSISTFIHFKTPQSRNNMKYYLMPLFFSAFVLGCGGGGSSSTTSTASNSTAPATPPKLLVSSNGALAKYAGTWGSECGKALLSNVYARDFYEFGSPVGSVISGTQTQYQFTTNNCSGFSRSTFPSNFTLTYVASVDITPTAKPSENFSGMADTVLLSSVSTVTLHIGFATDGKTFVKSGLPFSTFDFTFYKQPN